MYHVGKERHAAESQAFYDSIAESGNINFQSEAFQEIYQEIVDAYFGNAFDFSKDYAKFYEEFAGYVSGNLKENGGTLDESFAAMFFESDAINDSWNTLHNLFLEDGKAAHLNGRENQQTLVGGNTAEDRPGDSGVLRGNQRTGIDAGGRETPQNILSGVREVYGAEAEGEAQSYGEIGNFAVQDGQTGSTAYLNKYADGF